MYNVPFVGFGLPPLQQPEVCDCSSVAIPNKKLLSSSVCANLLLRRHDKAYEGMRRRFLLFILYLFTLLNIHNNIKIANKI
jgi:hypothetical protein